MPHDIMTFLSFAMVTVSALLGLCISIGIGVLLRIRFKKVNPELLALLAGALVLVLLEFGGGASLRSHLSRVSGVMENMPPVDRELESFFSIYMTLIYLFAGLAFSSLLVRLGIFMFDKSTNKKKG